MAGVMRGLLGCRRFFLKAHDAPVFIDFDDAELAGGPLGGDSRAGVASRWYRSGREEDAAAVCSLIAGFG